MKKTILITGSTDGIGKLTATKFANDGHNVLVHGRNEEKLKNTISEIRTITDNENVTGFPADFSDLNSAELFANKVSSEISHIDILINNAGVFKAPVQKNDAGLNIQMVVNYLYPYLLTKKLLPLLKKGSDSRIINLSSAAQSPVSIEILLGTETTSANAAYSQSKLALTMWSFNLSKKLDDISVIAVNPGSLLDTKMAKEAFGQIWSPAEKGVDIIYDLALSSKYQNDSGKYYDNDHGEFNQAHLDAYDENQIEKLIKTTNTILSKFEMQ